MYIGKLTRIVNSETYQGKTIIEVKKKNSVGKFSKSNTKKNQVVILLDNHYYKTKIVKECITDNLTERKGNYRKYFINPKVPKKEEKREYKTGLFIQFTRVKRRK